MKNRKILITLTFLVLNFILISFCNVSFSTNINTDEVSTYSDHCVVMESSTGKLAYEKDGYSRAYPASTTKIMTAILTLENCNLTDKATVSHNAVYSIPLGYSHANLIEGEELTINQLLHVLLIPSANDAAVVLAEHIAGSVESFSTMMNTKAEELGCKNTHFVNPNGIHSTDHYSTAYDLALIGKYAMQNETFREIVAKTEYTLPATNKYPTADRYFKTTNLLIVPNDADSITNYYYDKAIGTKTGYTNAAKDCIVATAKQDDKEYITVILGGNKTDNALDGRFIDCKNLFNYAFDNFKTLVINEAGNKLKDVKVKNADLFSPNLNIIIEDKINLLLKNDTIITNITPVVDITSNLTAPIQKDVVIGTITYEVDGNTYTSQLLAGNDIKEFSIVNTAITILCILLVLFILHIFFKIKKNPKNNKSSKKSKKSKSRAKHSSNRNGNDFLYW